MSTDQSLSDFRRHRRRGRGCRRFGCCVASAQTATGVPKLEYAIKKLPFDPAKIKGISEKLLVSHYENNYSGAVKRLTPSLPNWPASMSRRRRSLSSTASSARN